MQPHVWVEKTYYELGEPHRREGDYALGKALWSPERSQNGADIYRFMRDVKPGDVVLHLTDNSAFTGVSQAANTYEEFENPPPRFAGEDPYEKTYYLVRLRDFVPLDPPLSLEEVFSSTPYAEQLVALIDSGTKNLFYHRQLKLNQGAYLTPAPPKLVQILNDAYEGLTGKPMTDVLTKVEKKEQQSNTGEQQLADRGPLNVILYGPPGTGKTYSVQEKAIRILDPTLDPNLPDPKVSKTYREYLTDGRIEFVTFHPSYSYEEFVEGFRYDVEKTIPTLHEGVFQRLVNRALSPRQSPNLADGARIWKVSLGGSSDPHIFERCIANDEIAIGWLGDRDLTGLDREAIVQVFEEQYGAGTAINSITSVNYLVNEIRDGDYVAVLKNQREIRAIGVVTGEYRYKGEEYNQEYPHIRPVEWLDQQTHDIYEMNDSTNLTLSTIYPLDRISLQDFVDLLPKHQGTEEPYVLIIDEINRGNLSRIFGELITLLEPDKRRGAQNELSVRLPYSKRLFMVPPNLYVIGTMNTADRSIALIDVALRRRFEFEEMMPNVEVIRKRLSTSPEADAGTTLSAEQVDLICYVFEILNRRITVLLDRDHQVGHSYLLEATSMDRLHHVLYRRVFPLLQEYFYNDREKLRRLLGAYEPGAKKGFVASMDNEYKGVFGEEPLEDEMPWELHRYQKDELETALWNTFLAP